MCGVCEVVRVHWPEKASAQGQATSPAPKVLVASFMWSVPLVLGASYAKDRAALS